MLEGVCAYCAVRPAQIKDHVVPKSLRRNFLANVRVSSTRREWQPDIPKEFLGLVPSCHTCNIRKGSRRLVPPSWAPKIPAMNEFFGGVEWRVWRGSPTEDAYRRVHT